MEKRDEILIRSDKNPIIKPEENKNWKNIAAFNATPFKYEGRIGLLYRAMERREEENFPKEFSTIGIAWSEDGINFSEEECIIKPEFDWEKYGCEDPRITQIGDTYYIFYTALSTFPFNKDGIKVALAKTKDFKTFEKHLITPFNAKAMALFPRKINGKYQIMLNVNPDNPPGKIIVVPFEDLDDILNQNIWRNIYYSLNDYEIKLLRNKESHVEVGAVPIYTDKGWILIYSYINNYFTEEKEFLIEAAILDLEEPREIISRAKIPLLRVKEEYEKNGLIKNIVFPSGAIQSGDNLKVYYGASDNYVCVAETKLSELIEEILYNSPLKAIKYHNNPILKENPHNDWESLAVLNPAAILIGDTTHLFYRASDENEKSVIGYAKIKKGFDVVYRSQIPCYVPRKDFESFGCEDPRAVIIDDKVYMTYTAYDGKNAGVAVTSIKISDLENEDWEKWEDPVYLSEEGVFDKNSCIIPKKINGKYYIFHRINNSICLSKIDSLDFKPHQISEYSVFANPREELWDSLRIGISTPPIETEDGWILFYHGISKYDNTYRVSAMLLDRDNPEKILARLEEPILEPSFNSRRRAVVKNVVFPCGSTVVGDTIYLYYGEDDKWISVATISKEKLLFELMFEASKNE